jgi:hypothetical protein
MDVKKIATVHAVVEDQQLKNRRILKQKEHEHHARLRSHIIVQVRISLCFLGMYTCSAYRKTKAHTDHTSIRHT